MGDLFDSPWKIAIIAILIIVLFGAKKLPGAAKSLGQSMRILKTEVGKLHDDDEPATGTSATLTPPAQLAASPAVPSPSEAELRAQNDALQQQLRDMQRAAAMDPVSTAKQDAPLNQQS
jgi:sec-independent protein translocase protein TatA